MTFDCEQFIEDCKKKANELGLKEPLTSIFYLTLFKNEAIAEPLLKHHKISSDFLVKAFFNSIEDKHEIKQSAGFSGNSKEKQSDKEIKLDNRYQQEIIFYQAKCAGSDKKPTAYGLFKHFLMDAKDLWIPPVLRKLAEDMNKKRDDADKKNKSKNKSTNITVEGNKGDITLKIENLGENATVTNSIPNWGWKSTP